MKGLTTAYFFILKTTLAVFELEKDIYRFNSGWLFKKTTNQSDEKLITYMNIDITLARVQRDVSLIPSSVHRKKRFMI